MSYYRYRVMSDNVSLNFSAKDDRAAIQEAKKKFKKFRLYSKYYNTFPLPDEYDVTLKLIYDNTIPWWRKLWNFVF